MGSVPEEIGKAAVSTVEAMKSAPLALALLLVNGLFIGFCGYILSVVGSNALGRDKAQTELISKLATECGRVPRTNSLLRLYPPPPPLPIGIRD